MKNEDLIALLSAENKTSDLITAIKTSKSVAVPLWASEILKQYDPRKHDINDTTIRKDKTRTNGATEKVARVTYGLQKLSATRMTQMSFAIPVKREYNTGDDQVKKEQAKAIEAIYQKARVDAINIKRMKAYFAACEMLTIWYPVESQNKDYGFDSKYKLRCVSYSPMDRKFSRIPSAALYPVFDSYDDLIALAFEFTATEASKTVTYFHVYTDKVVKVFKQAGASEWIDESENSEITIKKIPGVYIWRPLPIWEDITANVNEIEMSLSRESDILRKNSAPVLKIMGKLAGAGNPPESEVAREVYQLENGGNIDYATWTQQVEALKYYIDTLKQNMEEELQLPNLSFENVKGLGAMSGEARKTLLTDAHLKVGDESGDIIEFLSRECNVIKSFVGQMNTKWASSIMDLEVEHIITPFIQNDESAQVTKLTQATQKPIMSQKTGIQQLGIVSNVDEELKQLQDEEIQSNAVSAFPPAI